MKRFWTIAIWLTVLLLLFRGGRAFVRQTAIEGVYPVGNAAAFCRGLFDRFRDAAKVRALEEENARLRLQLSAAENLLQAGGDFESPRVLRCAVISRGGTLGWWRDLRVNRGSRHGIAVGNAVVVREGLVGRVASVTAGTADVRLLTDPTSRVACDISPVDAEIGAVRGILYGGGWKETDRPEFLYLMEPLRLRYIKRDVTPKPGSLLVTSGAGECAIPRGIPVGRLLSSAVDESGLYRSAEVIPSVDFASLDTLFVITSGGAGGE